MCAIISRERLGFEDKKCVQDFIAAQNSDESYIFTRERLLERSTSARLKDEGGASLEGKTQVYAIASFVMGLFACGAFILMPEIPEKLREREQDSVIDGSGPQPG